MIIYKKEGFAGQCASGHAQQKLARRSRQPLTLPIKNKKTRNQTKSPQNSLPCNRNQTKKSGVIIANPIYDVVFKYLLEDVEIARKLLSTLVKKMVDRLGRAIAREEIRDLMDVEDELDRFFEREMKKRMKSSPRRKR